MKLVVDNRHPDELSTVSAIWLHKQFRRSRLLKVSVIKYITLPHKTNNNEKAYFDRR